MRVKNGQTNISNYERNFNKITIMKRLILLFFIFASTIATIAQGRVKYSQLVDGCWSQWKVSYDYLYGNYGSIQCYNAFGHPSIYCWRFTINNYQTPTKDQIKLHRKTNTWFEYSGTFEYYISDEYPDIRSQLIKGTWVAPWNHDTSKGQTPCVKRTLFATIKIAPYKKNPVCYNIFFNGGGFAIDLCDNYFKQ